MQRPFGGTRVGFSPPSHPKKKWRLFCESVSNQLKDMKELYFYSWHVCLEWEVFTLPSLECLRATTERHHALSTTSFSVCNNEPEMDSRIKHVCFSSSNWSNNVCIMLSVMLMRDYFRCFNKTLKVYGKLSCREIKIIYYFDAWRRGRSLWRCRDLGEAYVQQIFFCWFNDDDIPTSFIIYVYSNKLKLFPHWGSQ